MIIYNNILIIFLIINNINLKSLIKYKEYCYEYILLIYDFFTKIFYYNLLKLLGI